MVSVNANFFQVILYVLDMESEVRFYRDVLGLTVRFPQGVQDYSDQMWVEFDAQPGILALHGGVNEMPDDTHEIVFLVEDINQARESIIAARIKIGPVRILEDGAPIAEGWDPAGHRFAIRAAIA
jgi:predicted enzyme related to lactoylglutathione lyase